MPFITSVSPTVAVGHLQVPFSKAIAGGGIEITAEEVQLYTETICPFKTNFQ